MNSDEARYRSILSQCFGEELSRSQLAKVRIVEGVITVLSECGFDEFRLDQVAKQAGVSRPLILHYFSSSDELFYFTAQFVRGRLHQYILKALSNPLGEDLLFSYIEAHFEWLRENPKDGKFWLLFLHFAAKHPRLFELHTELVQMGRERISSLISTSSVRLSAQKRQSLAQDLQTFLTGALIATTTSQPSEQYSAASVYETWKRWMNLGKSSLGKIPKHSPKGTVSTR